MIRSDGHPNVVRYFLQEQRSDFLYLALQLCQMSLRDYVQALKANSSLLASAEGDGAQSKKPESVSDPVRRSLLQVNSCFRFDLIVLMVMFFRSLDCAGRNTLALTPYCSS